MDTKVWRYGECGWIFEEENTVVLKGVHDNNYMSDVIVSPKYKALLLAAPDLFQVIEEARKWFGEGEMADGLGREYWTPAYAVIIDKMDAVISKAKGS